MLFRIGRETSNKTTPLEVILDTDGRISQIMKVCSREFISEVGPKFDNVWLARDKTKSEMA